MSERRKQIIYGALAVIAFFWVVDWGLVNLVDGPLEASLRKAEDFEKKIKKREKELAIARKASERLSVWEQQSLPSDVEEARSDYRAWLLSLVGLAGLSDANVDSGAAVNRKDIYQSLSFSIKGRGTLDQFVTFLYEFYSTDHLHQVRSISITPVRSAGALDVSMSIEALVLPNATSTTELLSRPSDRLALRTLADYRPIVDRNLFGVGGGFDAANYTYLSAVTYAGNVRQAWFNLRASDEVLKLTEGDLLQVGEFRATVVEIENADVVIESDGERWLLSIGENLDQAFALPPDF